MDKKTATQRDIDMFMDFIDIQCVFYEKLNKEKLDIENPDDEKRIVEIFKETVREFRNWL